jgi:hypothetical protein
VRLTEAEVAMLGDGVEHTTEALCWNPSCAGSLPWAVERIVAERLREVESERDAARVSRDDEARRYLDTVRLLQERKDAATARAESAEAAHEALRKDLEALADEWEQETRTCDGMTPSAFAPDLRALLARDAR